MDPDDQESFGCEEMKVLEGKSSPRGDNDVWKRVKKAEGVRTARR
jgi:hypothetical protein